MSFYLESSYYSQVKFLLSMCLKCGFLYFLIRAFNVLLCLHARFQVYINKDIVPEYLGPIPKSNREIVRKILSAAYCNKILSRNDVTWSAGGQIFLPVAYRPDLVKAYEEEMAKERSIFVGIPKLKLARREDQTILVRGYIYRIDKVARNAEGQIVAKVVKNSRLQ